MKRRKTAYEWSNNLFWRLASLLLGAFVLTFVYNLFLVPNHIVIGGVSGLAVLLNRAFHLNTSLFINVANVILVILSFIFLGKKKTIDQLIGCIVYIIMLNLTEPLALQVGFNFSSKMLLVIVVSLIYGIANGLIYRAGYSTGGTDFLSQILSVKLKKPITSISLVFYITIILLSIFILPIYEVLLSIFVIYVSNKITNIVLFGQSTSKMIYILSNRTQEIEDYAGEAKVGITEIKTERGSTFEQMLLCVVHNTQYEKFKYDVLNIDPEAKLIANKSYEVEGGTKRNILPF